MKKALVLVLSVCLLACRKEPATGVPAQTPTTVATAKPRDGGRLVRRLEGDVQTLNYLLHTTDAERLVLSYLHTPLVDLDRNLQPVPGTAARWEIGDGGRSYTFFIDPRATFSDGKPVRAADVLFTISRVVDEQSPQFASFFDALDRGQSKVLDEKTVKFVFREPRGAQLLAFNIAVLPEHVYGQGSFKNDFNDKAVGNGPYELTAFQRGRRIELRRRASFWGTGPHIDSVVFQVIADDAVAWKAMKRGDIDEMRVKPDVWAVEKDRPDVAGKINFISTYTLSYNCIAWNVADPVLQSADVRRALAMAYDRPSIIGSLYRGEARPVTGPFTPDQNAYNPAVQPIEFDLPGAAALLDRAGWRDGDGDGIRDRNGRKLSIELLVPAGHQTAQQQGQVLQSGLKSVGVALDIRTLDGAAMFERVMSANYQAAFMAWTNDPEPDLFALFHSTQMPPSGMNIVRYRNADVDRIIESARSATDPEARRTAWQQVHELLARDQPYLWTVQVANKWAVNKRVHDVEVAKGTGLFFWSPGPLAWWLE